MVLTPTLRRFLNNFEIKRKNTNRGSLRRCHSSFCITYLVVSKLNKEEKINMKKSALWQINNINQLHRNFPINWTFNPLWLVSLSFLFTQKNCETPVVAQLIFILLLSSDQRSLHDNLFDNRHFSEKKSGIYIYNVYAIITTNWWRRSLIFFQSRWNIKLLYYNLLCL